MNRGDSSDQRRWESVDFAWGTEGNWLKNGTAALRAPYLSTQSRFC